MNVKNILPILTDGDTYLVTSPFGWRVDPVTGKGSGTHKGVDLVLWQGWGALSAIGAAWDGVVVAAHDGVGGFSKEESRGNYVVIDHGGGVETHYYHLAVGSVAVSKGDRVSAGQLLGQMGSTGYSTGAHLHFQMEVHGVPVDPLPYITGEAVLYTEEPAEDDGMDNTPAEWAADAVQWALENGILYGDETGNLRLHEACTREMMLVFLYRAVGGGG